MALSRSSGLKELSILAAGTPHSVSASTWSFISEISGEITTASPGETMAGTWKHTDLPPPVGRTTITSRPPLRCSMASFCSGRNSL
jgi:hypothetical protein